MGRKTRRNCYCCSPFLSSPGLYQQLPRSTSKQYRSASVDTLENFLETTTSSCFNLSGGGNTIGGEYSNMYSSAGNLGVGVTSPGNTLHLSSQPSKATYTTASSIKL